jgi:RHS repeat-associated protein
VNGIYAPPVITQITEQDPWGLEIKPLSYENSVNSNNFKFLNRLDIVELNGVSDLVNRFYDKQNGRFWSTDPIIEEQEHLSLYQYGWNNPVRFSDPNGDCPNCVGALIGGLVEFGSQAITNYSEGKSLRESVTDIDIGDVALAAGEGFLTGGTSAIKSIVVKGAITVGAEVVRNTVDVKIQNGKPQINVNKTPNVVKNTIIGLTTGAIAKVLPAPHTKVKAEITPKQAVRNARAEAKVINDKVTRIDRINIEKKAKVNLKNAKEINGTVNGAVGGTAAGTGGELAKRKTD